MIGNSYTKSRNETSCVRNVGSFYQTFLSISMGGLGMRTPQVRPPTCYMRARIKKELTTQLSVNEITNTLLASSSFPSSSIKLPPNKTALFPDRVFLVNPLHGGNSSPVFTGTVHLPIRWYKIKYFSLTVYIIIVQSPGDEDTHIR